MKDFDFQIQKNVYICCPLDVSVYLSLYSPCVPWPLFQFLNLYIFGRTPWTEDHLIARLLPTHRIVQTENKCKQTSMPRVGFEPTIPVFERAKTVRALDRATTGIGVLLVTAPEYKMYIGCRMFVLFES
jgi:hypothetical protein